MRRIFVFITLFFLAACSNKATRLESEKCGLVLDDFVATGFSEFSAYTFDSIMLQQGSLSFFKFNPRLSEYKVDHKFVCRYVLGSQRLYLQGYFPGGSNVTYGPDDAFDHVLLIARAVNAENPPPTSNDVEILLKKPPFE